MYNLLSRYPIVNYGESLAQNITTRIKFKELAKDKKVVYYPYMQIMEDLHKSRHL